MDSLKNGTSNALKLFGVMIDESKVLKRESESRLKKIRGELALLSESENTKQTVKRVAELEEMELFELDTIANYEEYID